MEFGKEDEDILEVEPAEKVLAAADFDTDGNPIESVAEDIAEEKELEDMTP